MAELHEMTALELRRAIENREVGVRELVIHYLQRIQKHDGSLNAIAEIDETAIEQAEKMDSNRENKPLFGLPVLVKDNIDVKGLHTTAGSLALADNIAREDAPVVRNLRDRGALILGKTHMTEFANYTSSKMPNGYSSAGGQVFNAYSKDADPSGSSTGSAVAMSAGFCALAVGTDTSFSVIGCATCNGVAGLKPPHGALSARGIVPISHTLDSAGALTKDMSDAIALYSGMKGGTVSVQPADIKGLRIGVNTWKRDQTSEEQLGRYDNLFAAVRREGAIFEEVVHPWNRHMGDIMRCEFRHDLEEYLASSSAKRRTLREIIDCCYENPDSMMKYGIDTLERAMEQATGRMDDEAYITAMKERESVRVQLLRELQGFDACVMTGPTSIMHFAGLPSVALPMCMGEDGNPKGIILYGADEKRLYAAALAIERCCEGVTQPRL